MRNAKKIRTWDLCLRPVVCAATNCNVYVFECYYRKQKLLQVLAAL